MPEHCTRRTVGGAAISVAGFVLLYWPVFRDLVRDWAEDGNYSHGFAVVPLTAYFVYERRHLFASTAAAPSAGGLAIVLAGVALLVAGTLGAELFVTRCSMLVVLAGSVAFVLGWSFLRLLSFPLAFLLLMIPIPAIVFNQVAFPLQLFASRLGVAVLSLLSVPVLREGNVIVLANTSLQVAEACSGIRSIVSLLTIGIVYGYFMDPRPAVRLLLAAVTLPLAILANGFRVAFTGLAAHYYGPSAAEGVFHALSGWLMFVPAIAMLFAVGLLFNPVRKQVSSDVAQDAIGG